MRGHKLPLVVRAAVAQNELGRVFVGHDDRWLSETRSMSIRVVRLEGLLQHAGVEVGSNLVDVARGKVSR